MQRIPRLVPRLDNHPFIYVFPVLALLGIIIVYPMVYSIFLSLAQLDGQLQLQFVGTVNFQRIFQRPQFWIALRNSMVFTGCSVIFQTVFGFIIALLLNHRALPWKKVFRVIFVLPWTVTPVLVATVWVWMYNPQYGILNETLVRLGLIERYVAWLGLPGTALGAVIIANTWRGTPFVMLTLLAGLQAIPQEQYEAARVDGATSLKLFYYITVPNLKPVLAVVLVLNTIWNFKLFDIIYVMTGGGPAGRTEILPTLIYRTAFVNGRFGEAAAIAVMMFLVILVAVLLYLRLMVMQTSRR